MGATLGRTAGRESLPAVHSLHANQAWTPVPLGSWAAYDGRMMNTAVHSNLCQGHSRRLVAEMIS